MALPVRAKDARDIVTYGVPDEPDTKLKVHQRLKYILHDPFAARSLHFAVVVASVKSLLLEAFTLNVSYETIRSPLACERVTNRRQGVLI